MTTSIALLVAERDCDRCFVTGRVFPVDSGTTSKRSHRWCPIESHTSNWIWFQRFEGSGRDLEAVGPAVIASSEDDSFSSSR